MSIALAAIGELLEEVEVVLELERGRGDDAGVILAEVKVEIVREARNRVMAAEARFSDVAHVPLPSEAL